MPNNPYYHPEKLGLRTIGESDCDGRWGFDKLAVWQHVQTGVLYWAQDAGCSCPAPFEDYQHLDDLRILDLADPDWLRAVDNQERDGNRDEIRQLLHAIAQARATSVTEQSSAPLALFFVTADDAYDHTRSWVVRAQTTDDAVRMVRDTYIFNLYNVTCNELPTAGEPGIVRGTDTID